MYEPRSSCYLPPIINLCSGYWLYPSNREECEGDSFDRHNSKCEVSSPWTVPVHQHKVAVKLLQDVDEHNINGGREVLSDHVWSTWLQYDSKTQKAFNLLFWICAALAHSNDNGILTVISEQRCRCISYAMRICEFSAGCCIWNSISNKKYLFKKKRKTLS